MKRSAYQFTVRGINAGGILGTSFAEEFTGGLLGRPDHGPSHGIIMNREQDQTLDNALDRPRVDTLEGIALDTLAPLDTICLQTLNSNYRVFLLDPKTGHALIEGGPFAEPVDALVIGSGSSFKVGWIGIGMRLGFWTGARLTSTSPVQSFHVETHTPLEYMPVS